jgi:hypothetical protein
MYVIQKFCGYIKGTLKLLSEYQYRNKIDISDVNKNAKLQLSLLLRQYQGNPDISTAPLPL